MAVPSASLYVGDLHPDITDGQLFDAFTEFKSLASVRVCRDSSSGRSLCYGYLNFISPQDALRALETKNHTPLNGRVMRIAWSHRDPDARRSGVGNVFVKNLSESINNVGLHEMFFELGNIISCKVATSEDGKSKGYGFVQFESEESANSAIEKLNGLTVDDKKIFVGKFVKKTDRVSSTPDVKYTNLYVKNLDPDISEDLLRKKFSEFGKIASLIIAKDENGASKCFGFVNFENPEDARLAMETMNRLDLGSKALYVGRAQKKTERQQLLRRQFEEKRKEKILKFKEDRQAQLQLQYARLAMIPGGGYPQIYYTSPPPGVVSRPGMVYQQPLCVSPGWRRGNGYGTPTGPTSQLPIMPNAQRQNRQGRGRINWHVPTQNGNQSIPFKDSSNQLAVNVKYVPNGRARVPGILPASSNSIEGSEMLSSKLAAATDEEQKQILGERLYPLVQRHKPDLVAKITGMLLEMDNADCYCCWSHRRL